MGAQGPCGSRVRADGAQIPKIVHPTINMRSFTKIALLAFVAQAFAGDVADRLADKLVEKSSSQVLSALPLDDTDLDDAVLAKAGAVMGGLTAARPIAPGMIMPRAVAPGSSEFASEAAKWAAAAKAQAKAQATTEMRRQPANTLTAAAAAAASEKMAPWAFADSYGRREMTAAAVAALTGAALQPTSSEAQTQKEVEAKVSKGTKVRKTMSFGPVPAPYLKGAKTENKPGPRGKL